MESVGHGKAPEHGSAGLPAALLSMWFEAEQICPCRPNASPCSGVSMRGEDTGKKICLSSYAANRVLDSFLLLFRFLV